MKRIAPLLLLLTLATGTRAGAPGHLMMTPADIKWGPAPPTMPAGAQMTVLYGDPAKSGALFIVRLKTPANYKIPAHWHPTDENMTVLSGTFMMGMGDKLDPAAAKPYPPGSFLVAPAKTNH